MKRILPPGSELLLVIDQFEELFTLTADEETAPPVPRGPHRARRRPALAGARARHAARRLPRPPPPLPGVRGAARGPEWSRSRRPRRTSSPRRSSGRPTRRRPLRAGARLPDRRRRPRPAGRPAAPAVRADRAIRGPHRRRADARGLPRDGRGRRRARPAGRGLHAHLRPSAQAACRQVFLRLVSADPAAQDTRRRVRRSELRQLELEPDALDVILARYGEHRLLTFDREPLTRAPTVEVAHEAILSQWDRLHGWIEERREDLLLHRRLVEAVDGVGGRRPRSGVPAARGPARPVRGLGGRDRPRPDRRRARVPRRGARRGGRGRTAAGPEAAGDAGRVRACSPPRPRCSRRSRSSSADEARDDARLATARQLAASAQANLAVDPERSILLAIEAAETTRRHDGSAHRGRAGPARRARHLARALGTCAVVGRKTSSGHRPYRLFRARGDPVSSQPTGGDGEHP